MLKHESFPPVLFRKWLLTNVVSIGGLGIGVVYYFIAGDGIFLGLSAIVFLFGILRGVSLYRLTARGDYERVEGTCIRITLKPLRKCRQIKIMDSQGVESTLMLTKQTKIKIGYRYRFYFKKDARPLLGSEYLDTALSTDCFLGCEELGPYPEETKSEAEGCEKAEK